MFKKILPGQTADFDDEEPIRYVLHVYTDGRATVINQELLIIGNPAGLHLLVGQEGVKVKDGATLIGMWESGGGGQTVTAEKNLISEEHLTLRKQSTNPSAPTQDADGNLYIKDGKLVIQYDDGGTVRYKVLDLTGTGVTWTHTTTAP